MKSSVLDLSRIPADWEVIPCGYFFKEKSIKNNVSEINLSVYRDYGVIPRDSRDDNHNRVSEDISNYKLVDKGDFVLNKMKCWMGSLGVSNYRGIVSPSYTVLEPKRKIHNQYFHYLLRSEGYRQIYESLSYGVRVGQWELRFHDFKQIPALYPKIKEQELISKYLDKKIQKIDSLTKKIDRKIELLKEQKNVLINHYVTKGLNQNIEMKHSGVEWIGKIPKNWEITKFKYQMKFGMGETILKENLTEDGIPVLSATENYKILGYYKNPKIILNEGDLIIPARGNSIGFAKIVKENSVSTQTTIYGKKITTISTNYIKYFCDGFKQQLFLFDRTAIPQITIDQVANNFLILPPFNEQIAIVEKLDDFNLKLNKLISLLTKKIDKLKEYRKSLISSVVIGKIQITEDMI